VTLGTKTIDIECSKCGAKAGERCSDGGVFVRDTAFHRERLSTAIRATKDANLEAKAKALSKDCKP
jgi:hypothetical protein